MKVRRLVTLAATVGVFALTACTPQQVKGWVEWHDQDPAAAEAFANTPEVAASRASGGHEQRAVEAASSDGGGWSSGNCASFADEAAAAGLPWGTFARIAQRESGCNPNAWVVDHDDDGGGLFGLNFKGQSMQNYWRNACGATKGNIRGNVPLQMECAAAAYRSQGMSPWRT